MKFKNACKILAEGGKIECYAWPSFGPKYIELNRKAIVVCDKAYYASRYLWEYHDRAWKEHKSNEE